jgi:drug/metabolite transporter (DMT)-like permease
VVLAAFLAAAVLAGGNAVAARFSNRELAPLWGAGLRFAMAAVILLAMVAVLRRPLPRGRALGGAALYGALSFAGSFAFAYYALVRIHAGLGQTLLALVPLATLLLAVAERQERLRLDGVLGSVIAVAGVAVISGASAEGSVPLLSLLATLGAVLCFAQAAILAHRLPKMDPVSMNAVAMAVGAVLLLAGSMVAGEPMVMPERVATWVSLAYVVPIGSVVVFILYLFVLQRWLASRAAYGFVIIPFVTVLLSSWLDDEPIGAGLVLGGLLVLAGVYIGALRPKRQPTE